MEESLIDTTIVCVATPGEVKVLSQQDVRSFLPPPLTVGQTVGGALTLTSVKKQIELSISPTRIEVKDMSGNSPALSEATHILVATLGLLSPQVTSLGLNYEFEAGPVDQAGSFIAQNFLTTERLAQVGELVGGQAKIVILFEGMRFTVGIEPRWGDLKSDALYININVHHEADEAAPWLSDEKLLGERFTQGWEQAKRLVQRFVGDSR